MGWKKISETKPPIGRPVLVRTVEDDSSVVAFLAADRVWYAGGALVQSAATLLRATPTEWCEPIGDQAL